MKVISYGAHDEDCELLSYNERECNGQCRRSWCNDYFLAFFILFSFSFGNLMFCVYFFNVFPTYDDKYVFVWHFTLTFFQ